LRLSSWLLVFAAFIALAALRLTAPRQYVVAGRSMLPGLVEGDVIRIDGWSAVLQKPQRHQRWLVRMPDETTVVKRIAGLPGEELAIDQGDLVIDGRRQLPSPHLLSETAARVRGGRWTSATRKGVAWWEYHHFVADLTKAESDPERVVLGPIYDSLDADSDERRRLHQVSSFGLAAVVDTRHTDVSKIIVHIGPQAAEIRLPEEGCFTIIAGRLAGRFIVAAWPFSDRSPGSQTVSRSPVPLPPVMDHPWSLIVNAKPVSAGTGVSRLALGIPGSRDLLCTIAPVDTLTVWRSIHHLPPADNTRTWMIPEGHVFLLGDNPSASRDSRQFGAVSIAALVGRLLQSKDSTRMDSRFDRLSLGRNQLRSATTTRDSKPHAQGVDRPAGTMTGLESR